LPGTTHAGAVRADERRRHGCLAVPVGRDIFPHVQRFGHASTRQRTGRGVSGGIFIRIHSPRKTDSTKPSSSNWHHAIDVLDAAGGGESKGRLFGGRRWFVSQARCAPDEMIHNMIGIRRCEHLLRHGERLPRRRRALFAEMTAAGCPQECNALWPDERPPRHSFPSGGGGRVARWPNTPGRENKEVLLLLDKHFRVNLRRGMKCRG